MNRGMQFVGEWWVPSSVDENFYGKHKGTLTIGDEITLELLWVPSDGYTSVYHQNDVMWGDSQFLHFTLFNCTLKSELGSSKFTLEIGAVLTDIWVKSVRDKVFDICVVEFPYLRNWARPSLELLDMTINQIVSMKLKSKSPMVTSQFGNDVQVSLIERIKNSSGAFKITLEEDTNLMITSQNKMSVLDCFNIVTEFSQFLSIALFAEQNPYMLTFGDNIIGIDNQRKPTNKKSKLIFPKQESQAPNKVLIKFNELKSKVPSMLELWHKHYKSHAPISNYLVKSINNNNIFDAPDFLIVVQALEGYFKRFLNKVDGKDNKKFEDAFRKMIDKFKSVELIKQCHFNIKLIRDTRDYYTHFMPDDEVEAKHKDVAQVGDELYDLTQKCKILLACCILDMLGLNSDEINVCCKNSPLEMILPNDFFER